LPRRVAVTDEKGEARFDVPPGVYTFGVEAEGYEPIQKTLQVGVKETKATLMLKPMTKGFLTLDNVRLRGLIRASSDVWEIGRQVKHSEGLIKLSPVNLRKFATKQFEKTAKLAQSRTEELRRLESSTAISFGPKGVAFSRHEKKRGVT
jgi:hypothetical protein